MSHSDPVLLPFRILVEGWDDATRVTVFDGHNRLRVREMSEVNTELPKGLYQVRLERLGSMEDHFLIHDTSTDKTLMPPLRRSAMPAEDTRNTHEFYVGPGTKYSTRSTVDDPADAQSHVRLMVMLRASGDSSLDGVALAAGLTLFAMDGTCVTGFEPEDVAAHEAEGWLIYSALLAAGNYLLVRTGPERSEFLPISLYAGWDSMVFVPHEGDTLRLSRASLDLVQHDRGFDPADRLAQTIDGAMQGLGERLDLLPQSLRNAAINGKFSHPMVGLIGAHSHFLSDRRREKLERAVLYNLWKLLPGSPDVIGLLLMALEREEDGLPKNMAELQKAAKSAFGLSEPPELALSFPPLLKAGQRAIVRAAVQIPELIVPDSWLEAATLSSFEAGGAWAVWDQDNASVERALGLRGAPNMPSPQKLYAAIKRAISAQTGIAARNVRAASRIHDVMTDPRGTLPRMMRQVAADLGAPVVAAQPAASNPELVSDVMRSVQETLLISSSPAVGVTPQTDLPEWLIDYVRGAVSNGKQTPDPHTLSRQVGVPLRHMTNALERVIGPEPEESNL